VQSDNPESEAAKVMTLEAFADTIIPGEKRSPYDRAIAGAATGAGAVTSGAVELLENPAGGLAGLLDDLARLLNGHALAHAGEQGLALDETVPAFVALPFADRTALVLTLTGLDHPEQALWVGLALFCNMAFDSAAHLSTPEALAGGHPGLLTIGYAQPEPDQVWRFPSFSYGRALADLHPHTTPTGSPA
jgi:hypothetical protein